MPDQKLITKGENVPLKGLLDQAAVHNALYAEMKAELNRFGFTEAHGVRLQTLTGELQSERAQSIDARALSKDKTTRERAAQADAKAFKRLVLSGADDLLADGELSTADRQALNFGGTIGRSTPNLIAWLTNTGDVIGRNATKLQPLLGGVDVVAKHKDVLGALQNIQGVQETAVSALPAETQDVYVKKGELLGLIEKMNRAGKRAVDGDALRIGRFNKDQILRAVKERRQPLQPTG